MIFDLSANSNGRKLPELNPDYPQDQSVTFIQGNAASAVFTAAIAADGRPAKYTYQWYADDAAVEGATAPSYTMSGFSASGTHKVYCVVTNAAGSVTTRTATLTVDMYTLPVLDASYPANASVTINNSVTSKVVVSTDGNPAEYTYQWYKDGVAISGATSPSYTFTPTEIGSNTLYCEVTNAAGTVTSRTATITGTVTYLYNKGDQCTSLTNGWTAKYDPDTSYYKHGTLTTNAGNMTITANGAASTSTGAQYVVAMTSKTVNLANAKKLYIRVTGNTLSGGTLGYRTLRVRTGSSVDSTSNVAAAKSIAGTGLYVLDVSSLTGSYYIGIDVSAENNTKATLVVTEVYYA